MRDKLYKWYIYTHIQKLKAATTARQAALGPHRTGKGRAVYFYARGKVVDHMNHNVLRCWQVNLYLIQGTLHQLL